MQTSRIAIAVLLSWVLALPLVAQTTTAGSITGTVVDPQGAVVPQAKVTAIDVDRNTSTSVVTDNGGVFLFMQLLPTRYTLTVEKAGFEKLVQQNVILNINARLSVGNLTLRVGAVSETVEVRTEGLRLQTESAERATSIVGSQLENIIATVPGRTPLSMMRVVPGVVSNFDTTLANNQIQDMNINGARGTSLNATLNGVSNLDTGSNTKLFATVSLDAVQEFKVLTSNYQAQYGKAAGGTIMLVTKSGGKDFHGSAYWFYRDKALNANSWIQKRDVAPNPVTGQVPKVPYHYNDLGYTIGGPIYIPGKFNTKKDKLFFFFSEEYQRQLIPGNLTNLTIPTALEAAGDFSQSVTKNTAYGGTPDALYIHDPLSALPCNKTNTSGCFADGGVVGRIPANRQYAQGIALLKWLFNTANTACPTCWVTGQKGYNYQWTPVASEPRHEQVMRVDANLTSKWQLWGSFVNLVQDLEKGDYVGKTWTYSLNPNFPLEGGAQYYHPGYVLSLNLTGIINPTLVNETTFGIGHHPVTVLPGDPTALTQAATGVSLPTFYAPYANWIPRFAFTGTKLSNTPQLQPGGGAMAPFQTYNTTLEWADNLSKSWPKHLVKAGIYIQRNRKNQTAYVQSGGSYDFGDSSSNPLDTGFGFANAAAGVYSSFSQASNFLTGEYRYTNLETYIQDTWKVARRLTLDVGLRAYWIQPTYDQDQQTSTFWPSKFNPSQAVQLFWPCYDASGNKIGGNRQDCNSSAPGWVSTVTLGLPGPASLYIGKIVPNSGSLTDGILPAGVGINKYLMKVAPIQWAPRVGFALDLTGNGNVVLRAGGGMFYDRYQGNEIFNVIVNPPSVFTPTVVNGFVSGISSSSLAGSLLAPSGLTAISYGGKVPTIYNYSAGIQSKLPWTMVLDVAYVGSHGSQLLYNTNINAVPYGAAFSAANQDPTKWGYGVTPTAPFDGSKAYDSNFLRPYLGYGDITLEGFGASSNYNSLQVTVDRRFAKGLFLGAVYVWSKCLTTASTDGDSGRIDSLTRVANYGPCSYDIPQSFTVNYVYPFPGVPRHGSWDNKMTRALLNGWQLSGDITFRSGSRITPNYSISGVSSVNLTGSGSLNSLQNGGARPVLVGNPYQGTSDDPYNRLNASAFAPPTRPSYGLESGYNYIVGPGINQWDTSLQKSFALTEKAKISFRVDAYNVFNHTQFSGLNSTINFTCTANCATYTVTNLPYDSTGKLVNKNGFGTVSGVRYPRILQLVTRFVF